MLQHVVDFRRLQLVVDRHHGSTDSPGAEHRDQEARCVQAQQRDPVAGADALRTQHAGGAPREFGEFAIAVASACGPQERLVGLHAGVLVEHGHEIGHVSSRRRPIARPRAATRPDRRCRR
jgi:hypothetical protein